MSQTDDDGDKQFEPSQKKLEDARKKGEVPRSADLTTAAGYGGFYLVATVGGTYALAKLGTVLSVILADAPDLATDVFDGGLHAKTGIIALAVAGWSSLWFAIPALATILAILAQRSFVVAPSKLEPKLNRVSMLENAKNKFGRQGLFEFAKSFAKLAIYSVFLGEFLVKRLPEIVSATNLEPLLVTAMIASTSVSFILIVVLVAISIGIIDFFWQRAEYTRKNMMTRKEMVDENKQMEGDPHIKQQRRQKGQQIAMNQMLSDVPTADVVIVNPTHYAVALKWERTPGSAPTCVAKGLDEVAARIREIASKNGIAIHRDPQTARALYSAVEVGSQIWPEHFKAVAAAIRFSDEMAAKAKATKWK
jgi:flagellar biosynthesis protein FlhB